MTWNDDVKLLGIFRDTLVLEYRSTHQGGLLLVDLIGPKERVLTSFLPGSEFKVEGDGRFTLWKLILSAGEVDRICNSEGPVAKLLTKQLAIIKQCLPQAYGSLKPKPCDVTKNLDEPHSEDGTVTPPTCSSFGWSGKLRVDLRTEQVERLGELRCSWQYHH